jgi:hypothetical protein
MLSADIRVVANTIRARNGQASPSIPDFALLNPGYARSFPAHAGIQTGSPHSQGRSEIYGLLFNSDAAVQSRKDSHSIESLD